MFSLTNRFKLVGIIIFGVALAAGILWFIWPSRRATVAPTVNQNIDTTRQQYADLYQAAWRPDAGRGNVLMTATLFVPMLIDLLGRDTGRSETENQLYRAIKETTKNQIVIFLTVDSVAGPLTDQEIRDSLSLSAEGQVFSLVTWKPLIAPSRIVNVDVPASSQTGVLIFQSDRDIDWSAVTNLQLMSRNIGDIAERNFVWIQPSLLSAVE